MVVIAGCGADLLINLLLTIWLCVLSASPPPACTPRAAPGLLADAERALGYAGADRWLPGLLHAFYLLWVYYDRREKYRLGRPPVDRAPFVFSDKVQSGGMAYGRW